MDHAYQTSALLCLPANRHGRDFLVGDLHGMRAALNHAMADVEFDEAVDRLFSVGDLVDRGPDPMGCLRLLKKPWFYAVLGNHERMLLAYLGYWEGWASRFHAYRYSRSWVQGLDDADYEELTAEISDYLTALPLAIRVGGSRDRFYVVHADRHVNGSVLTDDALEIALDKPRQHVKKSVVEALTWSRHLVGQAQREGASSAEPGVSRTYVGHTVLDRSLTTHNHVYLDRGAYQGHPLRLLEHVSQAA